MKMEPIVSSETSAIRTQTPGNYPKRNNLHLEHGESLRTRLLSDIWESEKCLHSTPTLKILISCSVVHLILIELGSYRKLIKTFLGKRNEDAIWSRSNDMTVEWWSYVRIIYLRHSRRGNGDLFNKTYLQNFARTTFVWKEVLLEPFGVKVWPENEAYYKAEKIRTERNSWVIRVLRIMLSLTIPTKHGIKERILSQDGDRSSGESINARNKHIKDLDVSLCKWLYHI